MIGINVITSEDLIVKILDKVRICEYATNNIDGYVCQVVEHLNGDASESGKVILISPYDIVSTTDKI